MAEETKAQSKPRQRAKSKEEVPGGAPDVSNTRRSIDIDEFLAASDAKWHERHEGAVIKTKGSFGHPSTKRLYDRYFAKLSQYLFFIPVYGRAILSSKNEKNLLLVEQQVVGSLDNAIKAIDRRIREAELLITAHNLNSGEENLKMEVDVIHASPLDRKFFSLLQKGDTFLLLNHALWIQGALSESYEENEKIRMANEWEVKSNLKKVVVGILLSYRRLMTCIREAQMQEAQESKKPQAEDNTKPSDLLRQQREAEANQAEAKETVAA
jgi:hypothetical protein